MVNTLLIFPFSRRNAIILRLKGRVTLYLETHFRALETEKPIAA